MGYSQAGVFRSRDNSVPPIPPDPPASVVVTITAPVTRQMAQRNTMDVATFLVAGTYTGDDPDWFEVKADVMQNWTGTPVAYQIINIAPTGGTYSGQITIPKGGWYSVTVKAVKSNFNVGHATVEKIGIGDGFIIPGQSTPANYAEFKNTPVNDIVSSLSLEGVWAFGKDFQPSADNNRGSPWPAFADAIIEVTGLPVFLTSIGAGSTSVVQWQPGAEFYDDRLKPAIQNLPAQGFRAILWSQGESDQIINMSQVNYQTYLRNIITQARIDGSWSTMPWGICVTETFDPPNEPGFAEPIQAAQAVVATDLHNFVGANTDDITSAEYRFDGVHMTTLGSTIQGERWAECVIEAFGW